MSSTPMLYLAPLHSSKLTFGLFIILLIEYKVIAGLLIDYLKFALVKLTNAINVYLVTYWLVLN